MSRLSAVAAALAPHGLMVAGAFAPTGEDGAPEGTGTLALVSADGAGFWPIFEAAPELADGRPHPLDRWSARILDGVAAELGATALYPFGGPPYQPFIRWSARAEGLKPSPVGLPVSPSRGLWAAYRGALAFRDRLTMEGTGFTDPCLTCPAPCKTACPVGALSAAGPYDVAACVAHADSEAGAPCRDGCLVRRACPVGAEPGLGQRRFHMAAFLRAQR